MGATGGRGPRAGRHGPRQRLGGPAPGDDLGEFHGRGSCLFQPEWGRVAGLAGDTRQGPRHELQGRERRTRERGLQPPGRMNPLNPSPCFYDAATASRAAPPPGPPSPGVRLARVSSRGVMGASVPRLGRVQQGGQSPRLPAQSAGAVSLLHGSPLSGISARGQPRKRLTLRLWPSRSAVSVWSGTLAASAWCKRRGASSGRSRTE